jgi:hypothetical protein
MTIRPSRELQRRLGQLRNVPIVTWVGIGCTALFGLIGLASGGVWSMLIMVALCLLATALYGLAFRRRTWLRLPRTRAAGVFGVGIAFAILLGSSAAYGAVHPTTTAPASVTHGVTVSSTHTPTPSPTPTPVVTTQLVNETVPIPFQSTSVDDATVAAGTSSVTTVGVNGVDTKTYLVTYTDGVETSRVLHSDAVTTPPVSQVTTVGTYVAPAAPTCTNGTYVNSAGNTVCRPEASVNAPSGATAKCVDGTYSFSQSRRGTCSSHGGVAEWL